MNKKLLILIFLLGVVLINGCNNQIEQVQKEEITKPNMTTEQFISELKNVRNSLNEIDKYLSNN